MVPAAEHDTDDGDLPAPALVRGGEQQAGPRLVERAGLDALDAVHPEELVRVLDLARPGHGHLLRPDDLLHDGVSQCELSEPHQVGRRRAVRGVEAGRLVDRRVVQPVLVQPGRGGALVAVHRPEGPERECTGVVVRRLHQHDLHGLVLGQPQAVRHRRHLAVLRQVLGVERLHLRVEADRRAGLPAVERSRIEHDQGRHDLGDARDRAGLGVPAGAQALREPGGLDRGRPVAREPQVRQGRGRGGVLRRGGARRRERHDGDGHQVPDGEQEHRDDADRHGPPDGGAGAADDTGHGNRGYRAVPGCRPTASRRSSPDRRVTNT